MTGAVGRNLPNINTRASNEAAETSQSIGNKSRVQSAEAKTKLISSSRPQTQNSRAQFYTTVHTSGQKGNGAFQNKNQTDKTTGGKEQDNLTNTDGQNPRKAVAVLAKTQPKLPEKPKLKWEMKIDFKNKLIKGSFKSPRYGVIVRFNDVFSIPKDDIFLPGKVIPEDKGLYTVYTIIEPSELSTNDFKYAFFVSETENYSDIGAGSVKCICTKFVARDVNQYNFAHDSKQLPFEIRRGKHHFSTPLISEISNTKSETDVGKMILNNACTRNETLNLQVFVDSPLPDLSEEAFTLRVMIDDQIVTGSVLHSNEKFALVGFRTPDDVSDTSGYFYIASAGDYQISEAYESEKGHRKFEANDLSSGLNLDGVITWSRHETDQGQSFSLKSFFSKIFSKSTTHSRPQDNKQMDLAFAYYCEMAVIEFMRSSDFGTQYNILLQLEDIIAQSSETKDDKISVQILDFLIKILQTPPKTHNQHDVALFIFLFLSEEKYLRQFSSERITEFILSSKFESKSQAEQFQQSFQSMSRKYGLKVSQVCRALLHEFDMKREAPLLLEWLIVCSNATKLHQSPIELKSGVLSQYPVDLYTSTQTKMFVLASCSNWGRPAIVLKLGLSVSNYIKAMRVKLESTGFKNSKLVTPLIVGLKKMVDQMTDQNEKLSLISELNLLISFLLSDGLLSASVEYQQNITTELLLFTITAIDILGSTSEPEISGSHQFLGSEFQKDFIETAKLEIDKMLVETNSPTIRENALLFATRLTSLNLSSSQSTSAKWCHSCQQQVKKYIANKLLRHNTHGEIHNLFLQAQKSYPSENWTVFEDILVDSNQIAGLRDYLPRGTEAPRPRHVITALLEVMPPLNSVNDLPNLFEWKPFLILVNLFHGSGQHLFTNESLRRMNRSFELINQAANEITDFDISSKLFVQLFKKWIDFIDVYSQQSVDYAVLSNLKSAAAKCQQAVSHFDLLRYHAQQVEQILKMLNSATTITHVPLTFRKITEWEQLEMNEFFYFTSDEPTIKLENLVPDNLDETLKLLQNVTISKRILRRVSQDSRISFDALVGEVIPSCEIEFAEECKRLLHGKISFRAAAETFRLMTAKQISEELTFIKKYCRENLAETNEQFRPVFSKYYKNLKKVFLVSDLTEHMDRLMLSFDVQDVGTDLGKDKVVISCGIICSNGCFLCLCAVNFCRWIYLTWRDRRGIIRKPVVLRSS